MQILLRASSLRSLPASLRFAGSFTLNPSPCLFVVHVMLSRGEVLLSASASATMPEPSLFCYILVYDNQYTSVCQLQTSTPSAPLCTVAPRPKGRAWTAYVDRRVKTRRFATPDRYTDLRNEVLDAGFLCVWGALNVRE